MYALRIATDETRELVVDALRSAADQRTRVARAAAGKVADEKRAGKDVRSSAVRVTTLLAEADQLATIADELAAAEALPVLAPVTEEQLAEARAQLAGDATATVVPDPPEDDGTSPEAQALAAAAGLTDAIVEDGVDTGATAEDEPDGDVEDVLS